MSSQADADRADAAGQQPCCVIGCGPAPTFQSDHLPRLNQNVGSVTKSRERPEVPWLDVAPSQASIRVVAHVGLYDVFHRSLQADRLTSVSVA